MGRWSGFSDLISDFHFDHGHHGGKFMPSLSTRYHKLDDSIFVLCRNCGHSSKNEDELKKMESVKLSRKHFFTWSATAANNRLQKMSRTLANNFTRLQMKMEKAIPFQQGVGGSSSDNNGKLEDICCGTHPDQDNNNGQSCPDVVNVDVSKVTSSCCSHSVDLDSASNDSRNEAKLINTMVKQLGEIGRYHYETRHARIVQSHPSVSQIHSQGSVANPDKIIQFDIQSYKAYAPEELQSGGDEVKVTSDDFNVKSGAMDDMHKRNNKILENNKQSHLDLFYDSGTGSATTSISGSSLSSPSIGNLPVTSIAWNNATEGAPTNLNSSTPSVMSLSQKRGHDKPNNKGELNNQVEGTVVKERKHHASPEADKKEGRRTLLLDSKNSTNYTGTSITESTDETSLLIGSSNNKSRNKRMKNGNKNVEICNKKNSVKKRTGSPPEPLEEQTPLSLKSLKSLAYPPSKLGVTILEKEGELRHAPWFQAGIPRETALEILKNEPVGSFIVRESTTKSGCFALSLRVQKEHQPCGLPISHYLILKTSRGYKIKGFTKEFTSLSSLITHHSVMSELLPCPLSLPQTKKTLRVSRANSSDFVEPEKLIIGTFTDF